MKKNTLKTVFKTLAILLVGAVLIFTVLWFSVRFKGFKVEHIDIQLVGVPARRKFQTATRG